MYTYIKAYKPISLEGSQEPNHTYSYTMFGKALDIYFHLILECGVLENEIKNDSNACLCFGIRNSYYNNQIMSTNTENYILK